MQGCGDRSERPAVLGRAPTRGPAGYCGGCGMNMRAAGSPTSGLSAAQRAAMHVGPRQGLPHDPLALVLYARADGDASSGFAVGALDAVEIGACSRALML